MWKPKNLVDTLVPIYFISVIFCHGVIQYPNIRKSKINYSFAWSIISTILYLAGFFFVFHLNFDSSWYYKRSLAVYLILLAAVIFTMIVNIVVNWIYSNRILILNSELMKYDELLKNFGVSINIQREFSCSIKFAVGWIIYSIITCIIAMVWYDRSPGLLSISMKALAFHHGFHVNFIVDGTFFFIIKHMLVRFKGLNKVLSDVNKLQTNNLPKQVEANYKWAISRQINIEKDFNKTFRKIKRFHLELKIFCNEIMKIYGPSISLMVITMFFLLITQLFNMHGTLVNSDEELIEKLIYISTMIIWVLIAIFKFYGINYICAETINEWNKTGEIIHKLEIESEDPKFQKEIQRFSIQILQSPLKFTPCGLFDLGYYFVKDFVGAVTAQLLILIQTSSKD